MKIDKGRIINDFIEPNKRQYAIPVYQRNYEWSEEQCVKLFDDIVLAFKCDRTHFCGSIVYAPLKEDHNIHHYIIIDGQQRLTTIYLLLKALIDSADSAATKDMIEEAIFNRDKFDKYSIDISSKLKLKPIKSDDKQLRLLMENKISDINKSSGIWRNYELFKRLITKELSAGLYAKDIYKGVEKLICASILLEQDDNAQEMFERINSTGVPLTLSDKIRNFVLMTNANQEYLYENYWLVAENHVKAYGMDAFFMDYLNMKIDGFVKEGEAYDSFKSIFFDGKYTNEKILQEITKYAEFYNAFLYGENKKYSDAVNSLLQDLQKLKQTTVFLFLFRVFEDYDDGVIDSVELERILKFLLHYSIRRLICEVGSNSLRGLYKTLYSRVFYNEENKKHYYDAIVSFFMQLTSKDVLPSDEDFARSLKEKNLYRKNSLCKFLLLGIENKGHEKVDSDGLTIEHILPQNKNMNDDWKNMLGENWREKQELYVHTLGNLTLTGYNSSLSDNDFETKKQKLNEYKTKITILYDDVLSKPRWTEAEISQRADNLIKLIFSLYPIEKPSTMIPIFEPGYKEYSCSNPEDATYKTPNYYVLSGQKVKCSKYSDMYRSIVNQLYNIDKNIISTMARNQEKIAPNSKYAVFSYDPDCILDAEQKEMIDGTSIYFSTGFSAQHAMALIKMLLERYDIEESEFVYSAKTNRSQRKREDN